jgi:hypothetical protein
MTEGFGLEVDGRMKTVFPTLESGAEKGEGSQSRVSDAPSQGVRRCGKEVAGIVAD